MVSSSGWAASTASRSELSSCAGKSRRETSVQRDLESAGHFMKCGLARKHPYRFAIPVQCAHIDVGVSAFNSVGLPSIKEVGIDESSQIFVRPAAADPQLMQASKMPARQFERAPNPLRG